MNRRALIALFACALVTGCGDDDSPTSPSAAPIVFSAILSPANEVPPVGNSESGGRAAAQVTFNVTRGAGDAITDATVDFYIQMTGFPPGTTTTGAHIHPGAAGVNGPVLVGSPITSGAPFRLADGSGEYRQSGVFAVPASVQAILNNPGAFYFNIHSTVNSGGYARGQLTRVQ